MSLQIYFAYVAACMACSDAVYAVLAGRARMIMSEKSTHVLSRVSGSFMIGGGIWLALMRAR